MFIDDKTQVQIRQKLLITYGEEHTFRIERGVAQVAGLWTKDDGSAEEYESFCENQFIADQKRLEETFDIFDRSFEALDGNFNDMELALREPLDLDGGELGAVERMLGGYDPSAHLSDDLFQNKIAFLVLLNFPHYELGEKQVLNEAWSARDWAMARLGDRFLSRVPADLQQEKSSVLASGSAYVSEYNIYMGNLRDRKNEPLFPKNLKLISHWGIRDELKSHYDKEDGLRKQKLIYRVMQKIITQEIPQEVVNNSELVWNVYEDKVTRNDKPIDVTTEPNCRYQHILNVFRVMRKIDGYYPSFPTYVRRKFELQREIPESEVENLFTDLLSSPELAETAALIKKRLGRELEPFDIWYDGFKARSAIDQNDLNIKVSEKYSTSASFERDIENILVAFGFSVEQASFVAPKIIVDSSRGPGHAWGAQMKSAKSHLRTRVPHEGMDYKGFNIALHELGHSVEQTLSLHKVDYHLNHGVPIPGCTEAFAFIFQHRDLEMLGIKTDENNAASANTLDNFWGTAEIMAVSLVDMKIWNWLYEHPDATAEGLKKATLDIAKDIWNRYYADILGRRDEFILAIYSHMLNYPLYLADYPLGHIIQFQIEEHIKGKNLGEEMERICATGNILPQLWMKKAVGAEISTKPMLDAARIALNEIG